MVHLIIDRRVRYTDSAFHYLISSSHDLLPYLRLTDSAGGGGSAAEEFTLFLKMITTETSSSTLRIYKAIERNY